MVQVFPLRSSTRLCVVLVLPLRSHTFIMGLFYRHRGTFLSILAASSSSPVLRARRQSSRKHQPDLKRLHMRAHPDHLDLEHRTTLLRSIHGTWCPRIDQSSLHGLFIACQWQLFPQADFGTRALHQAAWGHNSTTGKVRPSSSK